MIYENLFLYPHRFVHMEEESAAIEAVNNLNGRSVKGRPIKVEKSELKYPRKPSAKPGFSNNTRGVASALKTDGSTRHSPGYCDLRAEKRTTTTTSRNDLKFSNHQKQSSNNFSKRGTVGPPSPASELARWLKSDPLKILGSSSPSSRSSTSHRSRSQGLPPTSQISQCREILQELYHQRLRPISWPFFKPLDASLFFLGLTDYATIIKHPMDLTIVKKKLDNGVYSTAEMFADDVRRIFKNCYVYGRIGKKPLVYVDPDDQEGPIVLWRMAKKLEEVVYIFCN